jgi:hypothetical protein
MHLDIHTLVRSDSDWPTQKCSGLALQVQSAAPRGTRWYPFPLPVYGVRQPLDCITLQFVRWKRYDDSRLKEGEIGGAHSTHGNDENAYSILVVKPEGKTLVRY